MKVKLHFVTFNLNCGLHEVFVGNRLNGCQVFGQFGFLKPNPNRLSVFCTPYIIEVQWLYYRATKFAVERGERFAVTGSICLVTVLCSFGNYVCC